MDLPIHMYVNVYTDIHVYIGGRMNECLDRKVEEYIYTCKYGYRHG